MKLPLLTLLIGLPLLGGPALWLLPQRAVRPAAAGLFLATLALGMAAVGAFDPNGADFQLVERQPWIADLNIHYRVGVDGLSLLFLPATALLFAAALVAAWRLPTAEQRLHYSLLLALEGATLGIFCALDTLLFFVFWELTLIPLYFLLAGWGATSGAREAASRYVLLMLAGGVALLVAFLILAASQSQPVFDLPALLGTPLPRGTQLAVFLLCLIGFGVKVPLVPLHTWLPQIALAGPGSLVALIVGLKLGAYGLIRFALPLAPTIAAELHWLLAGLGTVTLLYGAVGIFAQTNLRAALAYAGLSHVGFVVLGLASLNAQAVQGAVLLLVNFAGAAGGAMLCLEFLRQRHGSTDIAALGGVAGPLPLLAATYLVCLLAAMGLPGTSGFPGELLLVLSTLKTHAGAALGALFGLAVGAAAVLHQFNRAFLGEPRHPSLHQLAPLRPREWATLIALLTLLILPGLWPDPLLTLIRPAAETWAAGMGR